MATAEWIGGATATAEVATLTLSGTWETTDKLKLTVGDTNGNSYQLVVVAGSTSIASIVTTFVTAFNASTNALLTGITAAAASPNITLTADTPGVPFSITALTTETDDSAADSQTFAGSITTPSSGPNDFNIAANWNIGTVPVDGDSIDFTNRASDSVLYGLDQTSGSPTIARMRAYTGHPQVGTLTSPLNIKVTTLDIGLATSDGSTPTSAQIFNIKLGNTATVGNIYATRNEGSSGRAPVQIDVDNSSSAFTVRGSSRVGFATATAGETSTVGTLTVKDQATVNCGSGLTLTTLNPEGGTTALNAGLTTVNYGTGRVTIDGAGNVTTLNVGGDVTWNSSGTATNLYVSGNGFAHCYTGTVTNAFIYGSGAKLDADSGVALSCTFTNGVDCLNGAKTSQVNFGDGVTVTPTAV